MQEKFTANRNYVFRKIAGEAVLISVGEEIADFNGVVNLNASAQVLWEALQEPVTEEELVKIFLEKFEVSEEQAREDIRKTLEMMKERRLIKHV